MPVLAGFIVANVAVIIVALIGTVVPRFSLDLVLPAGYPTVVVILTGMALAAAAITRTAQRAWGVDAVLLTLVGGMLVAEWLGLAGPLAARPAEHMEATLAVAIICALLLAAILLGRAQDHPGRAPARGPD